jgi:hypothetical protein
MRDVYLMQQDLAETALAAAVIHYDAFILICASASCLYCVRVFGLPDL